MKNFWTMTLQSAWRAIVGALAVSLFGILGIGVVDVALGKAPLSTVVNVVVAVPEITHTVRTVSRVIVEQPEDFEDFLDKANQWLDRELAGE